MSINPKARAPSPVVVRGLGRHLELKELAKRQKAAAAKRETAAFHVDKRALAQRDGLYTVPKPFHLSVDTRAAQKKEKKADTKGWGRQQNWIAGSGGTSAAGGGIDDDGADGRRPGAFGGGASSKRGAGRASRSRDGGGNGGSSNGGVVGYGSRRREFRPQTNAGRDASLFERVMQDDDDSQSLYSEASVR